MNYAKCFDSEDYKKVPPNDLRILLAVSIAERRIIRDEEFYTRRRGLNINNDFYSSKINSISDDIYRINRALGRI